MCTSEKSFGVAYLEELMRHWAKCHYVSIDWKLDGFSEHVGVAFCGGVKLRYRETNATMTNRYKTHLWNWCQNTSLVRTRFDHNSSLKRNEAVNEGSGQSK